MRSKIFIRKCFIHRTIVCSCNGLTLQSMRFAISAVALLGFAAALQLFGIVSSSGTLIFVVTLVSTNETSYVAFNC